MSTIIIIIIIIIIFTKRVVSYFPFKGADCKRASFFHQEQTVRMENSCCNNTKISSTSDNILLFCEAIYKYHISTGPRHTFCSVQAALWLVLSSWQDERHISAKPIQEHRKLIRSKSAMTQHVVRPRCRGTETFLFSGNSIFSTEQICRDASRLNSKESSSESRKQFSLQSLPTRSWNACQSRSPQRLVKRKKERKKEPHCMSSRLWQREEKKVGKTFEGLSYEKYGCGGVGDRAVL